MQYQCPRDAPADGGHLCAPPGQVCASCDLFCSGERVHPLGGKKGTRLSMVGVFVVVNTWRVPLYGDERGTSVYLSNDRIHVSVRI